MASIAILALFQCLLAFSSAQLLLREFQKSASFKPFSSDEIETFEQRQDHFDASNTRTWSQRYSASTETFGHSAQSPIFLYIDGEGTMGKAWDSGPLHDYAQQYRALTIVLEHRYYGESHPVEDASTANLRYLSSEQALADVATFISDFKGRHNLTSANKVIAFGGSYPGNLATWARLKYPHLIAGAIASSAPIQARVDFSGYLKVTTEALENPLCVGKIREASKQISQLWKTEEGCDKLRHIFNLHQGMNCSNAMDVSHFGDSLVDAFERAAQYGGRPSLDDMCAQMTDQSTASSPIERLASLLQSRRAKFSSYKNYLKLLAGPNFSDFRSWWYQKCTEFGYFKTTNAREQPFGSLLPLEYFFQTCMDTFGPTFNRTFIERAIESTNGNYGGWNVSLSKVLFVNGQLDPWHALSVTQTLSPTVQAILIPEATHCADYGLPYTEAIEAAQKKIAAVIGQFLA